MSTRGDHAKELFMQGYTCAQAVVLAFEDVTGLDRTVAAKLSSGFGGGMGRLREVCGAVSGMFMVYDLVCGYSEPGDMDSKKRVYADIRELAARFGAQSGGSIVCRELLAGVQTTAGGDPEQRTPEYYAKRPCPNLVALAADVLDEFLREKQVI
ncbi:MAG: C_GCAxxG_C_C family protein [Ruminococcaceae bacterium]|nr:C_GCAxxG_C_C family protein [Oscillospiraceae bacterium]